jgi:hypothetical protein
MEHLLTRPAFTRFQDCFDITVPLEQWSEKVKLRYIDVHFIKKIKYTIDVRNDVSALLIQ